MNESKNPMNTKSIQNFILQSEGNFRIAAAVAETWREARRQLMSSFLDRLDTPLKRKLKGWKPWRELLQERAGYYIAKPEWGESYWIAFECYADGSEIDIGITWETDNTPKASSHGTLDCPADDIPFSQIRSRLGL